MTEDQQRQSPKERKSIHDIRNQDLVSRLLAATPPYLYSTPVGSNNFFFSDMLRSLVQARNNENARNIQLQQAAIARRPRKRSWSQHRPYYEHLKDRKEDIEKNPSEKPLELTNKQLFPITAKYAKLDTVKEGSSTKLPQSLVSENKHHQVEFEQSLPRENTNSATIPDPPTASLPPSELVLPPPPPVWYPPLYPPYGIDPLHFFIDLRVSGHIYDRKKENMSPLANADNNNVPSTDSENFAKHRQGSAFSVPPPRSESKTASVINLSASNSADKMDCYNKYYDMTETKENQPNAKNPNYILMQNLPRIYTNYSLNNTTDESTFEVDSKSDQDIEEMERPQSKEMLTHIDVEMIDSVKSRTDTERTNSPIEQTQIHQID